MQSNKVTIEEQVTQAWLRMCSLTVPCPGPELTDEMRSQLEELEPLHIEKLAPLHSGTRLKFLLPDKFRQECVCSFFVIPLPIGESCAWCGGRGWLPNPDAFELWRWLRQQGFLIEFVETAWQPDTQRYKDALCRMYPPNEDLDLKPFEKADPNPQVALVLAAALALNG